MFDSHHRSYNMSNCISHNHNRELDWSYRHIMILSYLWLNHWYNIHLKRLQLSTMKRKATISKSNSFFTGPLEHQIIQVQINHSTKSRRIYVGHDVFYQLIYLRRRILHAVLDGKFQVRTRDRKNGNVSHTKFHDNLMVSSAKNWRFD